MSENEEIIFTEEEDNGSDLEKEVMSYVLYSKRIKQLIKDIGVTEEINISFSRDGLMAIQEYFRLISSMLAFEMIESLEASGRKRINREIVQQSVNRLLSQSDAINISVSELQKTIETLFKHSKNSNIEKATDYVNNIYEKEVADNE